MKKLILLSLVLMASNIFGQTLLNEFRFNNSTVSSLDANFFSVYGCMGYTYDRANNASSSIQFNTCSGVGGSQSNYFGPSGSNPRSISIWYKTTSNGGYPSIFSYGNAVQYQTFGIYLGPSGNPILQGFNYDYDFGGSYATNTWHHLVITFDGTLATLFMNGLPISSVNRSLLNTGASTNFKLLASGGSALTMQLDDLKIYSGILTASQVYDLNTANILSPTTTAHSFCSGNNPTVANLTTTMGSNIKWYTSQFGGSPLISTTPVISGTYWCSQTVAGTESYRKSSVVTINTTTSTVPTFTQVQPICFGSTLSALPTTSNNGITGTWSPAINSTATTTYTFSSGACSPTATMTILVNPIPAAPTTNAVLTYAVGFAAPALTATGSNLLWYTQAVGGTGSSTAPTPNTAVAGNTNYWVSQTNASSCESTRQQITVSVGDNNCLYFDGTNDYLQVASTNQYPAGNSSYTIEAWVAPFYVAARGVVYLGNSPANSFTHLLVSGTGVTVDWGSSSLFAAFNNPGYQWQHIATTWDGTTRKIYINGNLIASDNPAAHNVTSWMPITIGGTGGNYAGRMDELRIFNIAKTAAQIQEKMYCEILGTTTGLQQYWRFNQGISGGNNSAITNAVNECMNGGSGLLNGFSLTGNTSNFISSSPMSSFIPPVFGFPSPFYVCLGSSYTLPTTSNNGITGTWSPAFNTSVATNTIYTFTPDAGQCSISPSVTVAVTNTPSGSTFTPVGPICAGDALAALPTQSQQGNPGTWSPAINNMATTTYTFTPNTGICANTATMTIVVNPAPTPTFTQIQPICAGTTFTLPTTSSNNFTGTWSPAINTSATTTYSFTPTAGQCASTTTMTVTVNSSGSTPTFTQVPATCSGTTITALPTTSLNGIVGTWSPAINNLATTTYTFTPTLGVCPLTAAMTITIKPTPFAPIVASPVLYAQAAATTPLTATGTNLLWYTAATGGTGSTTAPTPSSALTGSFPFWVSQTGANGCESPRALITVNVGGTNCLHFDGVNDYINFSAGITAPVGNSNYTIEAMVNLSVVNSNYQRIIGWGVQGANQFNGLTINSTSLVNFWWANDLTASYNFLTNTWYHVAATFDGTTRRLFVNGVEIGSDTPTGHNVTDNFNATIGTNSNATAERFSGKIDEVRIWNTARTSAQLTEKMSCEIQTFPVIPELMSYFNFNAGTGGGNNAGQTLLQNQISGAANGSLVGFALSGNTSNWLNLSPVFDLTLPTFSLTQTYCAGASIPALPLTSTNGITGTWSPTLSNTASGTYIFTPNAGQCAYMLSQVITVNTAVTPIFDQVAPICAGATLAALPTTSSNGVAGTWSPALNNMATTSYSFTPSGAGCFIPTTMTITVNPLVTPTFTQVTPICAGVSLGLNGVSLEGILGSWSPAINNTATTTYTYTANAGQCVSNTNVTMTVVVNPFTTPTFAPVPAICQGETLNALPITSTNSINGTWTPALNNMATTTYTFVASSGTCINDATMLITVNTPTIPLFTQVAPVCIGNSIAALATTSNNGINGLWSPAIDEQNTTTYTFSPNAGECAYSATMTIVVTSTPITPTFAVQNPICEGETFTLSTLSIEGVAGSWSPAINTATTTTYTFTPSANQCAVSSDITVVVTPAPAAPTGSANQTVVTGATIASLVVSPNTVIWYGSALDALNETNPLPTSTILVDGSSYFAVNSANGCASAPLEVVVQITAGLDDDKTTINFAMYPNPTSLEVTITGLEIGSKINLLDATGRLMKQFLIQAAEEKIDLKECKAGVYFVQVKTTSGNTATKKLIVRK